MGADHRKPYAVRRSRTGDSNMTQPLALTPTRSGARALPGSVGLRLLGCFPKRKNCCQSLAHSRILAAMLRRTLAITTRSANLAQKTSKWTQRLQAPRWHVGTGGKIPLHPYLSVRLLPSTIIYPVTDRGFTARHRRPRLPREAKENQKTKPETQAPRTARANPQSS